MMNAEDGLYVEPDEPTQSQESLKAMLLEKVVPAGKLGVATIRQQVRDDSKDTVTLVVNAYHSPTDGSTDSVEIRTMHQPETHEQMYKRRTTLQPGTHRLDTGWFDTPGYIVIENKTIPVKALDSNPETQEAVQAWLDNPPTIIFNDDWEIPPGELFVGRARPGAYLEMEVINGPVSISINVFPR